MTRPALEGAHAFPSRPITPSSSRIVPRAFSRPSSFATAALALFAGPVGFGAAASILPSTATAQIVKAEYACTAYQSNLDRKWAYTFVFATTRDSQGFFRAPATLEANVFKLVPVPGKPPAYAFIAKVPVAKQFGRNEFRVDFRGSTPTGAAFTASFVSDTTWNAFDRVGVTHDGRTAWGSCTLRRP